MVIGLVILVPFAIVGGLPGRLDAWSGAWIAVSGIGAGAAPLLAGIALGVFLAAAARGGEVGGGELGDHTHRLRASGFALGLSIGASLYAIGQVSVALPVVWALLPSRVLGVLVMTIPVALRGGLRMTRSAAPFVLVAGGGEVLGFVLFAFGARHGIAVTAVLASLFSALAAIGAYLLFRERLSRVQLAGIGLVVVAVATLSGIRAAG